MDAKSDQNRGSMVNLERNPILFLHDLANPVNGFPTCYTVGQARQTEKEEKYVVPGVYLSKTVQGVDVDECICNTSILPDAKVCNESNGNEWLVELSYVDNKNQGKTVVVDAKTLATKSNIIDGLIKLGIDVTQNNANQLVTYFQAVLNSRYPAIKSGSDIAGWIDGKNGKTLAIYDQNAIAIRAVDDIDKALQEQAGTAREWATAWKPLREKSAELRLALAASFASPLIGLLNLQPFLMHLYGYTDNGKTVCLSAAASVYGRPDLNSGFIGSFNATQNSIISRASYLRDLPLFLDEGEMNETAGKHHKGEKYDFDNLIYTLSEGKPRQRCDTSGNLIDNSGKSWNCIAITTSEEPLTDTQSKGGSKNRVIEIEMQDTIFNETGVSLKDFLKTLYSYYGAIGREWSQYICRNDVIEKIRNVYFQAVEILRDFDIAGKQASAMALLYTVDSELSRIYFNDLPLDIDVMLKYCKTNADIKATQAAYDRLNEYIAQNPGLFVIDGLTRTADGIIETDKTGTQYCYMFATRFSELMAEWGYNKFTIARDMAKDGYIIPGNDKYSITKVINENGHKMTSRFIKIVMKTAEN